MEFISKLSDAFNGMSSCNFYKVGQSGLLTISIDGIASDVFIVNMKVNGIINFFQCLTLALFCNMAFLQSLHHSSSQFKLSTL